MNRILYIASINIDSKSGGGLACRAYYNAVCALYPGMVDLLMGAESCHNQYENLIPVAQRNLMQKIFSGTIHRFKSALVHYLKNTNKKYDLCIINVSIYAGDTIDLLHSYGIKTIVIHHNYEVEYFMTNKSIFTLKGRFPYIIRKLEKNAYKKADLNLFLTQPDLEKLESEYGKLDGDKNHLIGTFECGHKDLVYTENCNSNVVAITGSLCSYQTSESIKTFERFYFDAMRKDFSNLRLIIAGRNPTDSVMQFVDKNSDYISVVKNPEDMDVIIRNAGIYFCPTHIGGGIKLRVMDGLRNGLPVLVHEISARGYEEFFDAPYFKVYSDLSSFINGLKEISTYISENDTKNIRKTIIDKYYETFGFESGTERMRKLICQIVN